LPTQTILINHRPYPVSLPVQNLIPNVQILVYPSTLSNVDYRKSIIPPISIPFTGNVMDRIW
jgi:hypothetical protein